MKALPTLADVARLSGVSTATVSRALNEPGLVREGTRARVQAAVKELGYTPHFGGRALASNRTNTVGAVIPTMENAIFARGLQALQEDLSEAGVTLLVATSGYDSEREARQIRTLLGRGVDAMVLIGAAREEALHALLESRGVPVLLMWWWQRDCPWPCVGFDNRAAARAIAERVLAQGHRQIAMIAGIMRDNDRAAARVQGVRDALGAAGVTLDHQAFIEAPYQIDAAAAAATRLLATNPRPTAIICGNDVLAAGAMRGIQAAGLSVPEDVSVTGYDDIELARLLDPPLTTVHVPHRRMGHAAAKMLLSLQTPDLESDSVILDTEIVDRASLSGPR